MHDMRKLLDLSNNLFESDLEKSDIESIFKSAEDQRKGSWFSHNISSNDLLKKWNKEGFPTDSRDIVNILKSVGFSPREINKVFKKAGYGSSDDPAVSPAMKKLSKYIIDNGYTENILKFLKDNYEGIEEVYVKDGTMVVEDIRTIFNDMVKEERPELNNLMKQSEQKNLGRSRK
jgi:hypothetical protein